jgi:hypothetical protein
MDNLNSIKIEAIDPEIPTIFVFGGLHGGILHYGQYEFGNFLTSCSFNVNVVYIKDNFEQWYFKGLNNLSVNYIENINIFRDIIEKSFKGKKIFIGNSAGGFASILYGTYLNVEQVLSFSPQTFLDKKNRTKYKDTRWLEQINNLHKFSNLDVYDLTNIKIRDTKIDIYYGDLCPHDHKHAMHMANMKNTSIHIVKGGEHHTTIKMLRDDGRLEKIIKKTIEIV